MFQIKTLDHIALRVSNLEASASWYARILCLSRVQAKEWGPFPIFMVAQNGTGVALFPTKTNAPQSLPDGDWLKGDHYAFQVDADHFEQAQKHLNKEGIAFTFQDHFYFHSIYFHDPDGHQLEITTPTPFSPHF